MRERERERKTKMRKRIPSGIRIGCVWADRQVIQFCAWDNYSLLCVHIYYCVLYIVHYYSTIYVFLLILHILLCTEYIYSMSLLLYGVRTDAVLFSIPVLPIPIIQYANHCIVRYGTSRRPHCPLAGSTPFSTNRKPEYGDSAQEPTPFHGTGKPHRHGVVVLYKVRRTSEYVEVRSRRECRVRVKQHGYDSRPFQLKPSTLPSVSETA